MIFTSIRSTIESMTLSSQISTSLDPLFFEEDQTVALVFNIENVVCTYVVDYPLYPLL